MPTVYYVNPSRRRKRVASGKAKRRSTTKRPRPSAAKKRRASTTRKRNAATKRKSPARKPKAARTAKRGTTMRKKRRSVKRRRTTTARRRKNPSTKRKAAAKKAAATRKRKAAARSRAAKKAARTRKRRGTTTRRKRNAAPRRRRRTTTRRKRNAAPKRRRRTTTRRRKRNPAPRRRRTIRRRRRRNPNQTRGLQALAKGRRAYHNRKRKGRGLTRHYVKKHNIRMKNNPATMMDAVKMALPIAGALYGGKFLTTKIVGAMPEGMRAALRDVGGYNMQKPVVALALFGAGFTGTRMLKGKMGKYRPSIVLGLGINLVDALVCTFAPGDVCGQLGVKSEEANVDSDTPTPNAGYVQVGEYVGIGNAPPIDDDITLADYVEIGDLEADLGALESELGLSAELGAEEDLGRVGGFANRHLGGTHRNEMLRPVPSARMLAPVPSRSFVGKVPHVSDGYDAPGTLYTGIFGGGW